MPIPIGYDVIQKPPIDLASIQLRAREVEMAEQQQMWNMVMQVVGAVKGVMGKKKATKEQTEMLKGLGILKDVQETAEPGTPEWNKFAESMMKKGVVVSRASGAIPTGKTTTEFNPEALKNLPEGITLKDIFPGVTLKGGTKKLPQMEQYDSDVRKAEAGQIGWDVLKNKYPRRRKEIEEFRKGKLPKFEKSPKFKEGRGLAAYSSKNIAKLEPTTKAVIEDMEIKVKTEEDFKKVVIVNRAKLEGAGVDVDAILEYFGRDKFGNKRADVWE